ncbi:MAG: c-type cytochrome biogenesis protein CcsB [Micrococcales bacterium]|nr:c-type cytochrome biogenesis protein CcsB [Micrococcales bacterium]
MLALSQYLVVASAMLVGVGLLAYVGALSPRARARAEVRVAVPVGAGGPPVRQPASAVHEAEHHGLAWYGSQCTRLAILMLAVSLVLRSIVTGHGPFANQHEFATAFAFGLIAAYAYFEWRYDVRSLAVVVLPVALGLLVYALMIDGDAKPLVPALQNNLMLSMHVFLAVVSYGAAGVAFAAAVLYLAHPWLASHIPALPSAETLDEIGYRAAVLSYPFMTAFIILGAIWAEMAWGSYWSWDPKETASLVTWLVYGAYLHARVVRDWRGRRAAWLLILGFAAVLFTFFGNLFFGGLHSYA